MRLCTRMSSAQMPLVIPATTSDVVTSHGYRNIFRLPTRDSVEGSLTARYLLKNNHVARCAVVTSDGAYGSDVARTFMQEMRNAHVDVTEVVLTRTYVDPQVLAGRIVAAAPDLVYFAGTIAELGAVFEGVAASERSDNLRCLPKAFLVR